MPQVVRGLLCVFLVVSCVAGGEVFVQTIGGNPPPHPRQGFDNGPPSLFYGPTAMIPWGPDSVLVCDYPNQAVRRVFKNETVYSVIGCNPPYSRRGYQDGPLDTAWFGDHFGVGIFNDSDVFLSDNHNHAIRMVKDGRVKTIAGYPPPYGIQGFADGPGLKALFDSPHSLVVDTLGDIFVADRENHAVRKVTLNGNSFTVLTVAGNKPPNPEKGYVDGPIGTSRLNLPEGLALYDFGTAHRIIVCDTENHAIRIIHGASYLLTTEAGSMPPNAQSGYVDGFGPDARFHNPSGAASTPTAEILIADTGNNAIRRLVHSGGDIVVSTVCGGKEGYADGTISEARFNYPIGIAVSPLGELYVSDFLNAAIRIVRGLNETL